MYNTFSKTFVLLFLFTFIAVAHQYGDSLRTYQLNDVVISATRTEIPLLLSPGAITVIDSAEIVNSGKATVFDLLKDIPGVAFTQQGGPGKMSNIYMRGGNTYHTLVMVDGVEMNMTNDPSNTYDFSYLSPDNVQRIEVLRGPQSTLYGSDAVTGVINIITRKGEGKPLVNISGEGGSYGTYKGAAGLSGSVDKFNYSLTLSRFSTDGFTSAAREYGNSELDGTQFNNFSSRLGVDLSENFSLSLFTRMSKGKSDYDQNGGYFGDDPTYIFDFEETSNLLQSDISLLNGAWKQTIGLSSTANIRKYSFAWHSSNSHYDGRRYKIDWQNNFLLTKGDLFTIGLEAERERSSSEYFESTFNSTFGENFANTAAIFVQNQLSINNEFILTAGIRYDNHNKFGGITTYRIAPVYVIRQTGTKFRFSIGNAFKSPSIFDLFDPAFGNPGLKPEKNKAWEAGIEQYIQNGKYSTGITYFHNSFTDMFGYDEFFRTINLTKAESSGAEFFINANFSELLTAKVNYTYTKAEDLSGTIRKKLLRRPADKFGITLISAPIEKLNLMAEILYIGDRDDSFFGDFGIVTVTLKPYTLVNFSASYSILNNLDIYGRIENLTNTKYEEIKGYQTAELSVYAGFRAKF